MIKVLLADDHKMFIDGMKAILENDKNIEIVGCATNGNQVLEILKEQKVDVAVLDIRMPELSGIELTRIIKQEYKNSKVLILTMYNQKDFIMQLMKEGTSGYILKNRSSEELLMAIHNIHSGKTHFGLEVLNTAVSVPESSMDIEVDLTDREVEVLCLIAEGMVTNDIASTLHIAKATVNTHRRNLLQKLKAPNDKHLVRYAIKKGFIKL